MVSRVVPQFDISVHPSLSTQHSPILSPLLISGAFSQVEDTASIPISSSLNRHSIPQRVSIWRRSTRRLRTIISRRVTRPIDTTLAHVSSNLCCTNFKVTSTIENTPTLIANVSDNREKGYNE